MHLMAFGFLTVPKTKIIKGALCVLASVSVATTAFLYTNYLGSGARQFLFNENIIPKYQYKFNIYEEDERAGRILKENAGKDAKFATNRTHTGAGEGISNVYSAFSGVQGYMEGFKYTVGNMSADKDMVGRRLTDNSALFSPLTSPKEVLRICEENGITHLVFSSQFEGDTAQLKELDCIYDEKTVKIYKLP